MDVETQRAWAKRLRNAEYALADAKRFRRNLNRVLSVGGTLFVTAITLSVVINIAFLWMLLGPCLIIPITIAAMYDIVQPDTVIEAQRKIQDLTEDYTFAMMEEE
jgi:hypothetical protein